MIVNQPHDKQLGIQLIESIESNKYNQLTIMVAYAKLSGVYRIIPYLLKFKNGGGKIRVVVGIDQQNTTYDALYHLLKISDSVHIFHSESIAQTFHIKCYWLNSDKECWYAIGSNNLTAGGLFSNYELSTAITLSGEEANATNQNLERIYSIYANSSSVCSRKLDDAFLKQLLLEKYVEREVQQRRALAQIAKRSRSALSKTKLFGNEVFPAPELPDEYRKTKKKGSRKAVSSKKPVVQIKPDSVGQYDNDYLIRLVPRAGDRSKQVHFTVDLLDKYFCLKPGDGILVQEMLPSKEVGEIEQRQVVFSQRNRNVKIELAGASMLDTNYPNDPETRPVLIIKRVNSNLFVYMILLDGNDGYSAINKRLKSLPVGRSLPYEVIDESTMFSLWNDCPIL